jgi:hypothetical protein
MAVFDAAQSPRTAYLGVKLVPNFENKGSILRAGLNYR